MGKEELGTVKAKRHTPNQIITFHRWRNQYGGMKADDAKRLKELEKENTQLKRLVADKETSEPVPEAKGGARAVRPPGAVRASGVRDLRSAPIDPAPRARACAR